MAEEREASAKVGRHPRRALARLAAGVADREEARRAVRHLLADCPACAGWLTRKLKRGHRSPDAISAVLDRFEANTGELNRRVEENRRAAEELIGEMKSQPPERRRLVVANSGRAASVAVIYRLIEESRAHRHQSAAKTLHYAELAVTAADRTSGHGATDAAAAAWAELGNARRIASDLAGAEAALQHAEVLAEDSGPDLHFRAELLSLRGSLATDRRDFATAERTVRHAAYQYARCRDAEGAVKALLKLALVHERRGEPAHGIRPAEEAIDLAVKLRNRRLELIGLQNLVLCIAGTGELERATALLPRLRRLFRSEAAALDRMRFEWMAARLEVRAGRPAKAAVALDDLRERYAGQGMPYEAALVSLDLIGALLDLGQRRDVSRIAEEAAELFRRLGVGREALMSLGLLARARSAEAADLLARIVAAAEATRAAGPAQLPDSRRRRGYR